MPSFLVMSAPMNVNINSFRCIILITTSGVRGRTIPGVTYLWYTKWTPPPPTLLRTLTKMAPAKKYITLFVYLFVYFCFCFEISFEILFWTITFTDLSSLICTGSAVHEASFADAWHNVNDLPCLCHFMKEVWITQCYPTNIESNGADILAY